MMSDRVPSIELLEATHHFPCTYSFKVIGLATDCFVGRVLTAVKMELPEGTEPAFSTRSTSGGRHVSVSIEPECTSAQHVIAIYHRVHSLDGIVMVM